MSVCGRGGSAGLSGVCADSEPRVYRLRVSTGVTEVTVLSAAVMMCRCTRLGVLRNEAPAWGSPSSRPSLSAARGSPPSH
ncbi:protein of unknown function [Streptomyces sp. KY75]|nr:protein of unknown function [Streptomyces sp. KY75]CAD5989995.1 protein of unknown function [Streptomyces sp. KY70]